MAFKLSDLVAVFEKLVEEIKYINESLENHSSRMYDLEQALDKKEDKK